MPTALKRSLPCGRWVGRLSRCYYSLPPIMLHKAPSAREHLRAAHQELKCTLFLLIFRPLRKILLCTGTLVVANTLLLPFGELCLRNRFLRIVICVFWARDYVHKSRTVFGLAPGRLTRRKTKRERSFGFGLRVPNSNNFLFVYWI